MNSNVQFIEVDAKKINTELINDFEETLGETLYPSDERRIFLDQQTQVIVGLKNEINETGKKNLLRYAKKEFLDALGEFSRTYRLQATYAYTTLKFTLNSKREYDIVIPTGTRATPDGIIYFETIKDLIIPKGSLETLGSSKSTVLGEIGNNFIPGQIKTLVDPIPYVASVTNIDKSYGGSNIEDDDSYRERIHQSPEALSTAGPEGSYEFWAKSADSKIGDIATISPSPGVVKIIVLMKDGQLPPKIVLDKVYSECSNKYRRPLTDNVQVGAPNVVEYDIKLTYYLDKNFEDKELKYRQSIEGIDLDCNTGAIREYINLISNRLGKSINQDEIRYLIQNAASFKINDKSYTTVRKIIFESPLSCLDLQKSEVGKIRTLTISYGGLD